MSRVTLENSVGEYTISPRSIKFATMIKSDSDDFVVKYKDKYHLATKTIGAISGCVGLKAKLENGSTMLFVEHQHLDHFKIYRIVKKDG